MTQPELEKFTRGGYAPGFASGIESETLPPGLDEDVIRQISSARGEPDWLLEYRLNAFRAWREMTPPTWAEAEIPEINFQKLSYFSKPKTSSYAEKLDPRVAETFRRLGVPIDAPPSSRAERSEVERPASDFSTAALRASGRNDEKETRPVALDAVLDSVSVATTFRAELAELGIIFCSFSEAVREHPDLVRRYLGTVVGPRDNFYAALNAAVFTDGSFAYIPPGVRCPMDLSTYFRIEAAGTGQFERTLLVADRGARVSYLEGCTAPARPEHQLHAAVVEIIAEEDATVEYSTVQNWYPGDESGRGGILNFVTKRGVCRGARSRISWTQVETGSAITWKYPSVILRGDDSVGEFRSVTLTRGRQQADTGTKMIHLGKRSRSSIVSRGISLGSSTNTYRGLVQIAPGATGSRSRAQCDSLLAGPGNSALTLPTIRSAEPSASVEHEATTSRLSEDVLFSLRSRGLSEEEAALLVIRGFAGDVIRELPLEFAAEADELLRVQLEGTIG